MKRICIFALATVLGILLAFGVYCLIGFAAMYLWNAIALSAGWGTLSFWQATGLVVLINLLFAPLLINNKKDSMDELRRQWEKFGEDNQEDEAETINVKVEVDVQTPDEDDDKEVNCKVTVNGQPADIEKVEVIKDSHKTEEAAPEPLEMEVGNSKDVDEVPVDTTALDNATANAEEISEVKVEQKKRPKRSRRKPKNTSEPQVTAE